MRNRFCASFRMAENAKRTPELTRKVKNCNVPRNKIKSAIFWQKSYRLEWYLIICHYLNLYVHCISFITKLFLLWKLTGAKSNFETMCLQERNHILKNEGRARNWPLSAGDRFIEVTVKAGLTVYHIIISNCCPHQNLQHWNANFPKIYY